MTAKARALPATLARIAEARGTTAALRVAYHLGGTEIYIPDPRRLVAGHRLVEALGLDLSLALHAVFGAGHLTIPTGPLRTTSNRLEGIPPELRGASNAEIARQLGCHVRSVTRARRRAREGGLNAP